MTNWVKNNRNLIIRNTFLLPILLVVIMSISHVVSWYDLGNPLSWAIYLSIAIEVFALASVSAATIKVNRASIWFLFGLVTFIQIVGNIFFEYREMDITDPSFLSWVELIQPFFVDWSVIDHRRLLAIVQGGTLPLMSLTALHYYMKFKDQEELEELDPPPVDEVEPQENETDDSNKEEAEVTPEEEIEVEAEKSTEPEKESQVEAEPQAEPEEEEELKYNQIELNRAIRVWEQTYGSTEGVSEFAIIDNYRNSIKNKKAANQAAARKSAQVNPKLRR
jgi:hypothetical protein